MTGIASALAYNFFFIPPRFTFTIQDPQNIITVLVLIGVAVASSHLAARVRVQADLAQRSAGQNASLAGFARQLLTGVRTPDELGQTLCGEVARLLDVHTVLLLPGEGGLALRAAVPPEDRLEAIELAARAMGVRQQQARRPQLGYADRVGMAVRAALGRRAEARRVRGSRGQTPARRSVPTSCRCS